MKRLGKKSARRIMSLLFSFLMLFSLVAPATGYAEQPKIEKQKEIELVKKREAEQQAEQKESTAPLTADKASLLSGLDWQPAMEKSDQGTELDTKVESAVLDEIQKDDKVNVIIKMKDQPNYHALQNSAKKQKKKSERAAFVKSQLESKAKASQKGLNQALTSFEKKGKAKVKRSFWINNSVAATVDKDALAELEKRDDIESITLDKVFQLPEIKAESKPRLPEWGLEKIHATKVWGDYGIKGEGIVVGIMDTGVDGNHEALKDNYRGRNGDHKYSWIDVSGQNYQTPADGHGHGTHVAGTAVGGGSGEPIGVAPGAEWIAAKIFNDGGGATTSGIHAAFEWFMAPGGDPSKAPHVVNNSWGNSNPYTKEFYDDVKAWIAAGIFPLFAAGNDGPGSQTIGSPGSFMESFAIGATDSYDQVASFSSRGPIFWENENGERVRIIKPDVSAPGHRIYSAWPTALGKGKYNTISGTSMATPHVAGAIALLLSANPGMTIDEVSSLLKNTARKEAHMGSLPNDLYGTGIVNIHQAVTEAAFAGELSGTVTDKDGKPLKAEIELPAEKISIQADDKGAFSYKIREGKHKVLVKAFGYQTMETTITLVKGEKTEVAWKLEQADVAKLSGTVTEKGTGKPVPYAFLRVKGTPLQDLRTNEKGEFQADNIPVGSYEIQVTGEGIKGKTETVDLQSDVTVNIEVEALESKGKLGWPTANNSYSRNAVSPNSIDAESLAPSWTYSTETKGDIVFSTPAVSGNQAIAVTDRGWIISVNLQNGEETWSVRLGSSNRSSPTIEDGKVFLSGGADGIIYALDLQTGKTIWSRNVGQPTIYEAPLYKDGTLFIGSGLAQNPSLFALNANNGDIVWRKELGADSYFGGAMGDDHLYIGTYQNRTIRAINPKDGAEIWKKTVSGEGFAAKPVFHNGVVYAPSTNFDNGNGSLYAFDAKTGEMKWSVPGIGDMQAASPIVFEDIVVMSSSAQPLLRAFDRETGTLLWETGRIGQVLNNGSVSANGLLFISGTSGYVHVLDVYTGAVLKDYALPSYSTSSIPITAGTVLVPNLKGIQSFRAEGFFEGTMTDKEGKPLSGQVRVMETGEGASTDQEGNFKLSHIPGEYNVKISSYGKKQLNENITLVSGYTVSRDYQLEDAEEGSLHLTVKDKRTKAALEDVRIKVADTPLDGVTGTDGTYEAASVYEGSYDLALSLNGYESKTQPIVIEPGIQNRIEVELQPFDIAVLNDWQGEVTALLTQNGYPAEERDWDVIEDLHRYKMVFLNGAYTSGGKPPSEATFNQLLDAAKEKGVNLIFADAWGSNYGAIEQLVSYKKDPKELSQYYGRGIVQMKVDVDHPIFKGFQKGSKITMYSRTGEFAWFNQYSGRHLGTVGNTEVGDKGTGVAFKPVSENSAHVLLGSHAASPWVSPLQGWLPDMQKILFNTVDFLDETKFGKVSGSVVNESGEPLSTDIEIVETNTALKTSGDGTFELFHEEGDYTLEVRSPGYETQQISIKISSGTPVETAITLVSTDGGTISGTVTDIIRHAPIDGATIKLMSEGETASEAATGSNGRFELTNVNDGNYIIRVDAEGYLFEEREVRVRGEAVVADFAMNPVPRVGVLYDYYASGRNFAAVMAERGIPVTNLTAANVVEKIGEFDVVFFNEMSTSNVKKDKFEAIMAAADEAGTSMIFGDTYYSDAPINQLAGYRGDPKVRATARVSNTPAGYLVEREHPIFNGAKAGDYIEVLNPSYSSIGYFRDYSGYTLASIQHEGREPYGAGVAYKPRTANSLELLMSGHSFTLAHNADHYSKAGKQMM
ncbi:MAG TPA: carboxypeptidase regulatory-like domain-containing protein, partial [Bacillaceae bacterium]